eukprot:Clim_evm102s156 gene=Clim_evmTU102s156
MTAPVVKTVDLGDGVNNTVVEVTGDQGKQSFTVNLFGGCLTSWKVNGQELIMTSKDSKFDHKKAIRGGIPIVFPQFGPWDNGRPQHGFARTSHWVSEATNSHSSYRFTLKDNAATRGMWPHSFLLNLIISLDDATFALDMKMDVTNTGDEEFQMQALFHNYFQLPSVEDLIVQGFAGDSFFDKTDEFKEKIRVNDRGNGFGVAGPTDAVHKSTASKLHVVKYGGGNGSVVGVRIDKLDGLPDTVVWNPWIKGAKDMGDFGDEEYKTMVCVEPGLVVGKKVVKPGETTTFHQKLAALHQ